MKRDLLVNLEVNLEVMYEKESVSQFGSYDDNFIGGNETVWKIDLIYNFIGGNETVWNIDLI